MPCALLSVHDKTDLLPFAQGLCALGFSLMASGNTARYLREHDLAVQDVCAYTGADEMLGGRVKTLHPAIHAGILARDTQSDQEELLSHKMHFIDVVVVNLYPFEKTIANAQATLADAIEQIDIGGVALLRAAAKNHGRVSVLCDTADYAQVLVELQAHGDTRAQTRTSLAAKAFALTAHYDAAIAAYFSPNGQKQITLYPVQELRYGENPHQSATLYSHQPHKGPLGGILLQGKELSYNNLLDCDAALAAVRAFEEPSVCIVKHASPCGIASADNVANAFVAALASDPVSAFGGVIACNKALDGKTVQAFGDLFIECIIAPSLSEEALVLLQKRPSCRVLQLSFKEDENTYVYRSIHQGVLMQSQDANEADTQSWQVVSKLQPSEEQMRALSFAWRACQPVKSNAIVFAQGTATVGIGSGQPNRLDCVHIAARRAAEKSHGAVMASDAFFPFSDAVEAAAAYGIVAIVQPGGSKRDAEVIAAADRLGLVLVFTGKRHFRH